MERWFEDSKGKFSELKLSSSDSESTVGSETRFQARRSRLRSDFIIEDEKEAASGTEEGCGFILN